MFAGRWDEEGNRRKAFLEFAELHRFDPLIAKNWYLQSASYMKSSFQVYVIVFDIFCEHCQSH